MNQEQHFRHRKKNYQDDEDIPTNYYGPARVQNMSERTNEVRGKFS